VTVLQQHIDEVRADEPVPSEHQALQTVFPSCSLAAL
jgi:hypothetical protein